VAIPKSPWWVYLVQCADGSYYTGCSTDVQRRVRAHNLGTGAKYTRSRLPVVLVYLEPQQNHAAALQREWQLKKLSHAQKERLAEHKR